MSPEFRWARSDREISKGEYDRLEAAKAAKMMTTAPLGAAPSAATTKTSDPSRAKGIEQRLDELKQLLDKGLISPEDAARKRKEILESL